MLNGGLWQVTRQYAGVTRTRRSWSFASVTDWRLGAAAWAWTGSTSAMAATKNAAASSGNFMAKTPGWGGMGITPFMPMAVDWTEVPSRNPTPPGPQVATVAMPLQRSE